VLRAGQPPSDELSGEIAAFTKTRLTAYKCPHNIFFLPELPKTATGKIQRIKLRS
jgi:benzoate-CoA ligase